MKNKGIERFKEGPIGLAIREMIFRGVCRHNQGERPNVLLFCNRRGGSTWMLNTMAAHPGCRYVNRPFLTAFRSRHAEKMPRSGGNKRLSNGRERTQLLEVDKSDETEFLDFARDVIDGRIEVYPSINFFAPYFNRITDRIVFQMTTGGALVEWFENHFNVMIGILLRHPISNALSIMERQWTDHVSEHLSNAGFVDRNLTGPQVDMCRKILLNGSVLERHVLDWTLKMLVPLRAYLSGRHPAWLVWSYEEAVLVPDEVVNLVARAFDFPRVEKMLEQAKRPSRTVTKATVPNLNNRSFLLSRWRSEIGTKEEEELMKIPEAFEVGVYSSGSDLPNKELLHVLSPR